MKVAIVHDYIKEFGGAERVLRALCDIFPEAPIYTASVDKSSSALNHFKDRKIITSWFNLLPFASKLVSPLRFLTPLIWGSFNFKDYDVVISSASWFTTKGFKKQNDKFIEICYCHTPPRWLYGYTTSVNFQKYGLIKAYAAIVGHFLRVYDFKQAQKVDFFIANSKEVAGRIKKFYRRDSTVIYPPVSLPKVGEVKKENFYFIVSRIVGAKGLDMAVEAAVRQGFSLKIAGAPAGYYFEYNKLLEKAKGKVEFLGQISDEELARLYKSAKAFLALSKDEDFGITPVEAMLSGTPVIAFNGGGYKETVIDGKTGVLFNDYSVGGLITAIKRFEKMKLKTEDLVKQADKFSKERFEKEIREFIDSKIK
ncbi:MAG: glycosyltransferase [Candidatus Levybacteria bacterium]|nr:glycosyltransferase [Candidatus Levybacteria bacterium]